jgi:hypothetical protein
MRFGPIETYPPDRGCDLAPHCLECPFPRCRYDAASERSGSYGSPPGPRIATRLKAEEAARLRDTGLTVTQIARERGCSRRTVLRELAIARAETGEPSARPRSRP